MRQELQTPNYEQLPACIAARRHLLLHACLADRDSALLTRHIASLRAALSLARDARPFRLDAMVVLPEHLHLLCTLPATDTDYATRIAHFKACFSRYLPDRSGRAWRRRRERGVWQRRYWEHTIRDERPPEPYRLHPLQPSETRACQPGQGLAVVDFPSLRRPGDAGAGLGRCSRGRFKHALRRVVLVG
ncbi:REP-associated tyrosine transposase [Frateuria sp.]|uniref:REP-associated tyrosine transposase n=1 Tax=Frateuria sp. TaxID=2211372 RepID=UPI003F7D09C4